MTRIPVQAHSARKALADSGASAGRGPPGSGLDNNCGRLLPPGIGARSAPSPLAAALGAEATAKSGGGLAVAVSWA